LGRVISVRTGEARGANYHRCGVDVHYGDDADANRPSKTQLKQKSQDLQDLGLAVAALSDERIAQIEMSDALREAIETFRRTRSHEGKRRQMQYVGKLMRRADEEALREAVAAATVGSARDTLLLHETEMWRAQLIADDEALTRWLHEHADCDTQQLRSLVRAARRDALGLAPEARQPRSYRELFLFLKPHLAAAA
jgi:ribosome-associated protein